MTPAQAARARDTAPSPTPQEHLAAVEPLIERLHPKEDAIVEMAPIAAQVKALFDEMHPADVAYAAGLARLDPPLAALSGGPLWPGTGLVVAAGAALGAVCTTFAAISATRAFAATRG